MATYTRAQFYVLVLNSLGALALGQDVEAEDKARIDLGAGAAFDALENEGIYGARGEFEQDAIAGPFVSALARYVANEIGGPYGAPYSEQARILATNDMRRALVIASTYDTLPGTYF